MEQPNTQPQDHTQTPRPKTRAAGNDQLSGHNYDGIEEYDNPTPGWWTWMFVGSVVFAIPYFAIVTLSQGDLGPPGFYERAVQADLKRQFAELGELQPDRATILRFASNPDDQKWLAVGSAVFQTNCVSCHGRNGSGVSGPNLTDDLGKNVKVIEDIADIVIKGRNNGAMPAWNNRLAQNEIVLVSSYVASLRGGNLPSQYTGEQGTEIPPWDH